MAIRQPPSDIKDANLRGFLQELRNAIGGVGDQVNKLTRAVSTLSIGGGGGGTGGGTDPGTNPPPGNNGDGLPPPPPTALTATPDVWMILLEWANPVIPDLRGTEIWGKRTFPAYSSTTTYGANEKVLSNGKVYRSKASNNIDHTPPTPPTTANDWWEETTLTEITERTLLAESAGTQFAFTGQTDALLTTDENWAFWVRNVDTEGLYSTYFPDDDTGIVAHTLPDPGKYIDLLIGSITESQLYQDLGARIDLIDGPAGIPNSVNARLADQYDSLVQQISDVAVSGAGFDSTLIWYFDTTVEGWASASNTTIAVTTGLLSVTATGGTPSFQSSVFTAVTGAAYAVIRMRVKRTGGSGWAGVLTYTTSNDTTYTATISEPAGIDADYVEATWDLAGVANWSNNSIKRLKFQLGSASGDNYSIDWIGIGRNAPGASYSQVEAVRILSDNKNRVFYQGSAPTSTTTYTLKTNDLWFDTSNGNKPYRWNGTTWVETTDTRLAASWAEIYDIKNATVSPLGAAAQRINGIASNATSALNQSAANTARIATEETTRANADSALSSQISSVSASLATKNKVFIQTTTPTASAVGDIWYDTSNTSNVLLKQWNGSAWVVSRTDAKTYYQSTAPTSTAAAPLLIGDLWFNTADQNRPYRWNGTSWVSIRDGYVDTAISAAVVNLEQAKIGYCSISSYTDKASCNAAGGTWYPQAFATAVKQVTISAAGTTGTIEQSFTAQQSQITTAQSTASSANSTANAANSTANTAQSGVNYLNLQYTVKVDNGGYVSGFGLASTPVNGTPFSEFYIRADRFAIGNPNNTKVSPAPAANIPFIVTTGSQTINGETVPAGVYIKDAYIQNGTITSAKIGNAAITNAKIGNSISSTVAGSPTFDNAGYITNYGTTGWGVGKMGDAVFNTVIVRSGTNIQANALTWAYFYNGLTNNDSTILRTFTKGAGNAATICWTPYTGSAASSTAALYLPRASGRTTTLVCSVTFESPSKTRYTATSAGGVVTNGISLGVCDYVGLQLVGGGVIRQNVTLYEKGGKDIQSNFFSSSGAFNIDGGLIAANGGWHVRLIVGHSTTGTSNVYDNVRMFVQAFVQ